MYCHGYASVPVTYDKPDLPPQLAVILEAEHLCMSIRGIQAAGEKTITSVMRGVFLDAPEPRAEFMALISHGGTHA